MRPNKIELSSLLKDTHTTGISVSYRGKNAPFQVGIQVTWSDTSMPLASSSGAVQITLDDPADFTGITDWNDNADWNDVPNDNLSFSAGGINYMVGAVNINCFGFRVINKDTTASHDMNNFKFIVLQD